MTLRMPVVDGTKCPSCGLAELQPRIVDETFEFGGEEGAIVVEARAVPVEVCVNCGEKLSGREAAVIRHGAICAALGLLTPEEIKGTRDALNLSQSDFARLTGIGEATISRWERGRLLQNRAHDRYLRLISSAPQNLKLLERLRDQAEASRRHASAASC